MLSEWCGGKKLYRSFYRQHRVDVFCICNCILLAVPSPSDKAIPCNARVGVHPLSPSISAPPSSHPETFEIFKSKIWRSEYAPTHLQGNIYNNKYQFTYKISLYRARINGRRLNKIKFKTLIKKVKAVILLRIASGGEILIWRYTIQRAIRNNEVYKIIWSHLPTTPWLV